MKVALIFIDGVGLSGDTSKSNPCYYTNHRLFHPKVQLPYNGRRFALETCLGVEGYPQSATGQTTIYTGQNAAKILGKHLFGIPNRTLQKLLHTNTIFHALNTSGLRIKFLNAYRPLFFTSNELFQHKLMSVTTEMNRGAGLDFNRIWDIAAGKALYHDFTNAELRKNGFDVPLFNAEKAARTIYGQTGKYDLLLYEYFLTDMAGHSRSFELALEHLQKIEDLILAVLDQLSLENTILLVVSDHGNIEDIATKSHTYNPAFCGIWGEQESPELKSLLDIYPYLINKFDNTAKSN